MVERLPFELRGRQVRVADACADDGAFAELSAQTRERLVRQLGIALGMMRKQPALLGRGRTGRRRDPQRRDAR